MPEATHRWGRPFVIATIVIVVVETIYGLAGVWALRDWPARSAFGEMFGALNTLFAGLAFAGVVYTIYFQVRESAESRVEQVESLKLVQRQIDVLREDVELQRRRDQIERGPFFRLTDNGTSGAQLHLSIENVGGSVIIQSFVATSQGCSVLNWFPSTWTTGEKLRSVCQLAQAVQHCEFRLDFRDRAGDLRAVALKLDLGTSPAKLDFAEVGGAR